MVNNEMLRRKQHILDELLRDGDNLDLPHEVSWIYSFLTQDFADEFRLQAERQTQEVEFSLGDCQCTCTAVLIPDARKLTEIEETLDAISHRVANRTECCASITTAVSLPSKDE
jgi:hypothetical protein